MSPSTTAEEQRFTAIYARHHADVFGYCARRVPLEDAFDATADVFLAAWRRLAELPADERALFWLYATAHKVLANQWRSRNRRTSLLERLRITAPPPADRTPETAVVRRQEEEAVISSLQRLRDSDQELLRLAEWEELGPTEIAKVIGISRNAVDQRLHRARRRLAAELGRTAPAHRHPMQRPLARTEEDF